MERKCVGMRAPMCESGKSLDLSPQCSTLWCQHFGTPTGSNMLLRSCSVQQVGQVTNLQYRSVQDCWVYTINYKSSLIL